MLNPQQILIDAFRKVRPFDEKGNVVNETNQYLSDVICSVGERISRGHGRHSGSVERLYKYLENKACV